MSEKKRIAHCIHHTHWDPFWYFTAQDAMVVFSYNVKEMLRAFERGEIRDFFLDGQTVAIDEYLEVHPEDREKIETLVKENKLIIGPFVSQLDPFISSGESIVNNLRLGIAHADKLGGHSEIAYLADPFGQICDFPKIFRQFGIQDFVFTRGVGDIYGLGNEFYFKSNDGSTVLCNVMLAGYGYGAYAFKEGTLFTDEAEDYNKISVQTLIDRLVARSTLENEFVFPLGFDQNPIMLGIEEKIKKYNEKFPEYEFRYTTWKDYMARVRKYGKNIKTHESEILSAQYHRIHISGMNSARVDIKNIIDETERKLTYEVQPLMSMLDSLGLPFDQDLLDRAWYTLVNCQTHASATHIDETNRWIKHNSEIARNIADALKIYLMRLTAATIGKDADGNAALVLFNTLPFVCDKVFRMKIVTIHPRFKLFCGAAEVSYSVVNQTREYGGVIRKDKSLMNEDKWYYKTDIILKMDDFEGISYKTIYIKEIQEEPAEASEIKLREQEDGNQIESERYRISFDTEGITIADKKLGMVFRNAIYLEDGGDEGDSYDYSYPDEGKDLIICDAFQNVTKCSCRNHKLYSEMCIEGFLNIPETLEEREEKICRTKLRYKLHIELSADNETIRFKGWLDNKSKNHRVRLAVRTGIASEYSYAGTQYGYIKRKCLPPELSYWREKNFFEEPSSTKPLLNHVSAVGDQYVCTIFTRGLKEYDFIGEGYTDMALTLLRCAGHVGLPDLNRRPGRPSGLANKIFETPELQMIGKVSFDFGITYYREYDPNVITNDYAKFAADQMYYQNQSIDKTIYPIAYFPINPLEIEFPQNYSFLSLKDSEASFGTVKKADDQSGYIVRIYNSGNEEIRAGSLSAGFEVDELGLTTLSEKEFIPYTEEKRLLLKGELRNYFIKKEQNNKQRRERRE